MEILPDALRLLGVAEPDLDDLVQEILLAAYESLDRFDPTSPASTRTPPPHEAVSAGPPPHRELRCQHRSAEARWVFGIAWRKVSHHLNRAYRRREVPSGLHPAPHGQPVDLAPSSEERIAARERLELAIEVLGTLAPERRILLVLHEAYEVPIVEIARALGINYNTACTRLRLAREDYRAAVARLRPEQRQALRASWLLFPLSSGFLAHDDGESPSAPAASPPPAPAPPVPPAPAPPAPLAAPTPPAPSAPPAARRRPGPIGVALGSAAAGVAGTLAVMLALAPPKAAWARRFGPVLPELLPARSACPAATPPQRTTEPAPVAPATEALHRPCPAAPRAAPPAGQRDDAFAEELRLLDVAREHLSAGDAAAALRQLAAHEARFPVGRLKSVREQLRAVARMRLAPPAQSTLGPAQSASGGAPSR
ncbi:sigma-70 family RNA polymerase sigma factor [Sorangium sp. So ce1036]|uniref:RNA polymerase sigma factor n=1 Tax=Sorangium sp. So ce1036 TaxID=3133328 RepID=UPI003EFF88B9